MQQSSLPSTGAPASAPGGAVQPAAPLVSAAEREAEQLRMVPYEQAFSIEIQRRAQERPEHLRGQGEASPPPAPPACAAAATADPADPAAAAGCPPGAPGRQPAPPVQAL
ncbi:hypothetical protein HF313_10425 [Massilia atriviolacea]|uniref:Uncharacterized protein n=1 Tax=Massilia atriviolacea TaxID=2495579 RepID=A0A430HHV9_9BURK|nr:hypothetical protein [Massilia atriviolacea]RSZ57134.1 hypothetical protein EJB06_20630 [Massilia atriviolacea]